LLAFLRACLIVGLPVGLAAWVLASPSFLVREVEIQMPENGRVDDRWVESRLRAFLGRPLLGISLAEVQGALAGNRWIAGVKISKSVPDGLVVQVVEKNPRALWVQGGELLFVDGLGEVIDGYSPEVGVGSLLILEWSGEAPVPVERAEALMTELSQGRPQLAAGAFTLEILAGDDFRLYTESLPFPVLLTAGQVSTGLERLELAREELRRLGVRAAEMDLRFPRRVIVQPGAPVTAPTGM
jgi:cell division protein FtsQ